MICASYSDGEIEVAGDSAGLRKLVQFLKGDCSGLEFEVKRAQRHALQQIELRERAGQLSIGVESSTLVIAGARKLFPILAQSIEFLIDDDSPSASNHLHIEFVPDHYCLSERSIPVVVTKIESGPPVASPH
ncbi:MAG: hypothetical protein ISP90_02585 [Nevskia sp.]|nr:hypothetical protein [Nevskia sp.]